MSQNPFSSNELKSKDLDTNNQQQKTYEQVDGVIIAGPPHSNSTFDMESLAPYTGVVSWFLVIVGWGIIYRNAKKLATRTETKSFIDEVTKQLAVIETNCVDYWLSGRTRRVETDEYILIFNASLMTLNSKLDLLFKRNIDATCVDLAELSTLATYQCEDVDSMTSEAKRAKVQSLLDCINTMHVDLYKEFQRLYKPTFNFKKGKKNAS
ncbi:hypothetical protein [Vibrio crassostreae]|uniref:hypothetical protein n=1 Tax=Vibrio crassostreae TaxID=246167 RepID=UPI004067B919